MHKASAIAFLALTACSSSALKPTGFDDKPAGSDNGFGDGNGTGGGGLGGTTVRGIIGTVITVKSKTPDNVGVAHVRGMPVGGVKAPMFCEGDIEFKFTSTTRRSGYRGRNTRTTWYLDHVKLLSIQTPGVANRGVDEDPDGDDDND